MAGVTIGDLTAEDRAEYARIIRECVAEGLTGWWVAFRPGEPPRAFPRCVDVLRDEHANYANGRYVLVRIPASPETVLHFLT